MGTQLYILIFVPARTTFQARKSRHPRDDSQTPPEPPAPASRHVGRKRPLRNRKIPRRLQRVRRRSGPLSGSRSHREAPSVATPRQRPQPGQAGGAPGPSAHPAEPGGRGAAGAFQPPRASVQQHHPEQRERHELAPCAHAVAQRRHRVGVAHGAVGGTCQFPAAVAGPHSHEDGVQRVGVVRVVWVFFRQQRRAHGDAECAIRQSAYAETAVAGCEKVPTGTPG